MVVMSVSLARFPSVLLVTLMCMFPLFVFPERSVGYCRRCLHGSAWMKLLQRFATMIEFGSPLLTEDIIIRLDLKLPCFAESAVIRLIDSTANL